MKKTGLRLRKMDTFLQRLRVQKLYYEAFPADERKPFGMIMRMRRKGRTDVWCMEADGKFAGFATTINGDDLVLIDYLAVAGGKRGEGIGSEGLRLLRKQYPGRGMFVEIESVYEPGDNHGERVRRKKFYIRNGMEELGVLADVFGVQMELLGWNCRLDFDGYQAFYREHYSSWAAEHLKYIEFPEQNG